MGAQLARCPSGVAACACGRPVHAARADEVDAAAEAVQCCTVFGSCVSVECAAFQNLRCEAGRCTGD